METVEQMKEWIDNASYEHLLGLWRNSASGNPLFEGEVGEYYSKVMKEKKALIGHDAAVQASKNIG